MPPLTSPHLTSPLVSRLSPLASPLHLSPLASHLSLLTSISPPPLAARLQRPPLSPLTSHLLASRLLSSLLASSPLASTSFSHSDRPWVHLLLVGGFIYFQDHTILQINALSLTPTRQRICFHTARGVTAMNVTAMHLASPPPTPSTHAEMAGDRPIREDATTDVSTELSYSRRELLSNAISELAKAGRMHRVTLDALQVQGFERFGWIHPGETFGHVIKKEAAKMW